jgi:hypothetical protein
MAKTKETNHCLYQHKGHKEWSNKEREGLNLNITITKLTFVIQKGKKETPNKT